MSTPVIFIHDPYANALMDLAQEFQDGFKHERDCLLNSFPNASGEYLREKSIRAALFLQLEIMLRERVETRGRSAAQRTGDETA